MRNKLIVRRFITLTFLLGSISSVLDARMTPGARGVGGRTAGVGYRGGDEDRFANRAPRPNPSLGGPISPFNCAELADIQQCCCQLKNIVQSQFDVLVSLIETISFSGLDGLITQVEVLVSVIETLDISALNSLIDIIGDLASLIETTNCCSTISAIDSKVDSLGSRIDNASCCSLISVIDSKVSNITNNLSASSIDVISSLIDNASCCSLIGVIDSKVSNITNNLSASSISVISSLIEAASCCSLTGQINTVVGSFGDPGITSIPPASPFTTLDQINNTNLTVIGWLKSIMAQLVGV